MRRGLCASEVRALDSSSVYMAFSICLTKGFSIVVIQLAGKYIYQLSY